MNMGFGTRNRLRNAIILENRISLTGVLISCLKVYCLIVLDIKNRQLYTRAVEKLGILWG